MLSPRVADRNGRVRAAAGTTAAHPSAALRARLHLLRPHALDREAAAQSVSLFDVTSTLRSQDSPLRPSIPEDNHDALMARLEEFALDLVARTIRMLTRRLVTSEIVGQAETGKHVDMLADIFTSIQKQLHSGLPIKHRASQLANDMCGVKLMISLSNDFFVRVDEVDPTEDEAWVLQLACIEMMERVSVPVH